MAKKPVKKVKATKAALDEARASRGKDHSPSWTGHETWDANRFMMNYYAAMNYYNIELSVKDIKGVVLKWMNTADYDKDIIATVKKIRDWRFPSTMAKIASCLLKGMPAVREDFNHGRSSSEWLKQRILQCIDDAQSDLQEDDDAEIQEAAKPVVSIQDRTYDISVTMCEDIEEAIDNFIKEPAKFDPKGINILAGLKAKQAKPAHTKFIADFYNKDLAIVEEFLANPDDEELKENYSRYTKKELKKIVEFYKEVQAACLMVKDEAKVTRAIKPKKPVAKDKLVEKLKYKKTDDVLKLVSINPVGIIGSKELYCYDTKTRKLYKYIAEDFSDLTIKGTTIVGYNENRSIGKTLRKPAEQLTAFKNAGKVALRTFMENISTTEIKANGRINENQILLKAV